jgi:RHS repeat-associated protein
MIRPALLVLLAPLLSGCWIYTNIQGNGTVASPATGNFNCSTGQAGDCQEEYTSAGSETLEATADPGHTFAKWAGCPYESLETCTTSWTQSVADDAGSATVTATFKEQNPPVQAAQYTYNALGQRITKTVNGQTTIFQYDLDGNLMAEIDAATGQPVRQHIHVNGEPVAQLTTNPTNGRIAVQYVHADHLGTPTLLTNQFGQVVADIEATPFGETYIDYAEVTHNRRFPGQYKDEETGLHYNYFRDYDPSLGRYIQSDPIGLIGDFSDAQLQVALLQGVPIDGDAELDIVDYYSEQVRLNHNYNYVEQAPLTLTDPFGLRPMGKNPKKPPCELRCYDSWLISQLKSSPVCYVGKLATAPTVLGSLAVHGVCRASTGYAHFDLAKCIDECDDCDD